MADRRPAFLPALLPDMPSRPPRPHDTISGEIRRYISSRIAPLLGIRIDPPRSAPRLVWLAVWREEGRAIVCVDIVDCLNLYI